MLGSQPAPAADRAAGPTVVGRAAAPANVPGAPVDATVSTAVDDVARRAREGDFDVRARARCAQERGQALGECTVGVARDGRGNAVAVVRFPNGFERALRFERGTFASADATMSGSGSDADWREEAGTLFIRVDDQRYELPASLVTGS